MFRIGWVHKIFYSITEEIKRTAKQRAKNYEKKKNNKEGLTDEPNINFKNAQKKFLLWPSCENFVIFSDCVQKFLQFKNVGSVNAGYGNKA